MSPEQAAGLTDLDERTDVYSLAAVIYEMIVGEIPGRWPTEEAVRLGRFVEASPAHRSRLAQAGPTVESALVRGLAIRHDQRTPSPAALLAELHGAPAPRRQYADQDVQAIVRRAAELEATNPTAGGQMTIGGVEALAAEVGIPADLVRTAARELSARTASTVSRPLEPPRKNWFLGGPTRILHERTVEGEVPETEFPVMVDEIRRVVGNVGQVAQLGRSFTWNAAGAYGRMLEVVVSVRAGRTRIIIQESLKNLIGGIYGGIGGGMGGGGLGPMIGLMIDGLNLGGAAVAVVAPAWLLITYATARTSYYYATRRRGRQLATLADRLEAAARELVAADSGALGNPARPGLLPR
jgi:hypothetical protein